MSGEMPLFDLPLEAAADLSAKMYFAVLIDSNGKAALGGAGTGRFILQNTPEAGQAASVRVHGVSFGKAAAAIAKGAQVASDANGKLVTATAGTIVIGIALTAATADGDIITVLLGANHAIPSA